IFVGFDFNLGTLVWRNNTWVDEGLIPGIEGEPHTMHEEPDGTLWAAMSSRGVFRARRPSNNAPWSQAVVKHFFESDGLPAGHGWIFIHPGPFGPSFSCEL